MGKADATAQCWECKREADTGLNYLYTEKVGNMILWRNRCQQCWEKTLDDNAE